MRNWVLARAGAHTVAIDSATVSEMVVLPTITPTPGTPSHIAGLVLLRNESIVAIELRAHLGASARTCDAAAFAEMLSQRKQDHLRWMAELEASVRERRPFKLTTDPHKCAFGKWYDAYQAPTLALSTHLWKLRVPHNKIHALGEEVIGLAAAGHHDRALERIEEEREKTLTGLLKLLDEVPDVARASERPIALVLRAGGRKLALIVDAVVAVQAFDAEAVDDVPPPLAGAGATLPRTVRLPNNGGVAFELDGAAIIQEMSPWLQASE